MNEKKDTYAGLNHPEEIYFVSVSFNVTVQ